MKIAVGSQNPAKIKAAKIVAHKLFSKAKVLGVKINSKVNPQPKTLEETIKGAIHRAKMAQKQTNADFGIGMEGGIAKIGKRWFEIAWMAVIDKNGKIGLGSAPGFQISGKALKQILKGKELADVINNLTKRRNVHTQEGAMGVITNGHLPRHIAYTNGLFFAFAPFVSKVNFWD